MRKLGTGIFILSICWALALSLSAAETVYAKDKVKMKISASGAGVKATYGNELCRTFKDLVALYSNYEIEVKVYPQGTFGGSQEAVLALRNGEFQMFNQATNNFAVHAPSVNAFSIPYMIDSYEQAYRLVDGPFGDVIRKKASQESGVRFMGIHRGGWRGIANSKRPIHKLEDMSGLKIRVPKSPTYIEMFKAWGVNPTPIGWNETFTALQQKVADGLDNPISVLGQFKFYEIQKYFTSCKYVPQMGVVIMNEKFYDGLSQEHKDAVEIALKETLGWLNRYVAWSTAKWAKICEQKGMVLYDLPDSEEARWSAKAKSIWPKLYDLAGGKAWVDRFDRAVKRAKK
ncbi:MAG: TRAP transporter substrate-binding protein [Desulfobacterales bacterium]